jgi:predicted amidophosphoribosyltransferase
MRFYDRIPCPACANDIERREAECRVCGYEPMHDEWVISEQEREPNDDEMWAYRQQRRHLSEFGR